MLDFDRTGIDQFVSLGSPQLPPPEGVIDQVGGCMGGCSCAGGGGGCCHSPLPKLALLLFQAATCYVALPPYPPLNCRPACLHTRGILTGKEAAPGAFHPDPIDHLPNLPACRRAAS